MTSTIEEETTSFPRHKQIGLALGPILALAVYWLLRLDATLDAPGRTVAAVAILMATWWMTEAIPLPATALIPIAAFPLLDVYRNTEAAADPDNPLDAVATATAPYADKLVFLFMGGFLIALALQKWNLHKRIALNIMRLIGSTPRRLLLGMMVATGFLSMWVSNTATALMMLPIAISVLAVLDSSGDDNPELIQAKRNFGTAMMLAIAYSASIGGLGTIIGSPPNAFVVAHMQSQYGIEISFLQWMILGVPLGVVFLLATWWLFTRVLFKTGDAQLGGGREVIQRELEALGPMSRGEWTVLCVFVGAASLWVFQSLISSWEPLIAILPFVAGINDYTVAIGAGLVLFLIPVHPSRGVFALDWHTAQKGMPWGVLLLFGGGLSLSAAVGATGLATYLGDKFLAWETIPLILVVAGVAVAVLFLTELTSNTATAATFVPIVAAVGAAIGGTDGALMLAMPAALAATCAFMLPVATPPNAIVYATGRVRIGQMVKAGLILNVLGVVLITLLVYGAVGLVFG